MSTTIPKSVLFGAANTGLAEQVGYTLYNVDGTVAVARSTMGVVEIVAGSGWYGAAVTFPNTSWAGFLAWDTGGEEAYVSGEDINLGGTDETDSDAVLAAIAGLSARISGANMVLTQPFTYADELHLIQGADYFQADGMAIAWRNTGGEDSDWPNLTDATVVFKFFRARGADVAVTFDATVVGSAAVQLELSAAQTATIPYSFDDPGRYELWATLTDGHNARIAHGACWVER